VSPERWERTKELFETALEFDSADRPAFLFEQCQGDDELLSEVKKLLEENNRLGSFLNKPLFGNLANSNLLHDRPETIGGFNILELLGAGGMGRVYAAYEIATKRKVALKVLNVNFSLYRDDVARFEREAWIGGRLKHANIVKAYGQGEASGLYYICMDLMEGPSLSEAIKQAKAESAHETDSHRVNLINTMIPLFSEVADALHYVHENGIIHRDIKPQNLLLTDGRSKMLLSDFGLARDEELSQLTRRGDFLGTIRYMSPEQLAISRTEVDRRTDIWSLGVSLYEAVTLDLPYTADTEQGYISAISQREPLPARVRNAVIPKDLETVLIKCLEKDPKCRYQTAADLRDDLRRITTGQPVLARRPSMAARFYRSAKQNRNKALALAAAACVCVAMALAAFSLYIFSTSRNAPPPSIKPFTTFPGGEYEPRFSPDDRQVAFVWQTNEKTLSIYVEGVDGAGLRRITTGATSESNPSWSPDGRQIAFVRFVGPPNDCGVFVIPVAGGAERKLTSVYPLEHVFERHLDWSPDGKYLALADSTGPEKPSAIFLVSARDGTRRQITTPNVGTRGDLSPAFSPDGKTVAFLRFGGWNSDDIYVVQLAGGPPRRVTTDDSFISDYAWMPDQTNILFSSKRNGLTDLWLQPAKGGSPRTTNGIGMGAYFVAVSHRTQSVAFSRWAADSNIWQVEPVDGRPDKAKLREVIASTMDDRSALYSPDGSKIAFRSNRSGTDEIWRCDSSGRNETQLTSFQGPLTGTPRWSADGMSIAFDSRPTGKGNIYVIPAAGGTPRKITNSIGDNVVPSWSQDGKWIYFASDRGANWQVWKASVDGESATHPAVQVTTHGGFSAFESPDGKWLYYAKGLEVSGLWRLPVGGSEEMLVTPELQPHFWGYWSICPAGIYFIAKSQSGQCAIKSYSLATQQSNVVALIPKEPPYSDSGLSVTRDGKSFLYPEIDHAESNILLISNFRLR
jgi:Tol biopolymer transport system component/serine/threonine protein kinase